MKTRDPYSCTLAAMAANEAERDAHIRATTEMGIGVNMPPSEDGEDLNEKQPQSGEPQILNPNGHHPQATPPPVAQPQNMFSMAQMGHMLQEIMNN